MMINFRSLVVLPLAGLLHLHAAAGPVPVADTSEVTLSGSGYIYPAGNRGAGRIGRNGLTGWKSADAYVKAFFVADKTGELNIALKLEAARPVKLNISFGGKTKTVNCTPTSGVAIIPAATFRVTKTGYQEVTIAAADKSASNLPAIRSILLSGEAASAIRANNSQYRGAPATHLAYPVPKDTLVEWFYNEISVPENAQPLYAYYMVNGWNGGYFGIQINSPTERRVLFSVWSAFHTDDPKQVPEDYRVKLLKKGADVVINDFGNEGSGGQSFWRFPWKAETTYKLLLHAKPSGDNTIYSAWFFDPATGKWKFMATWDKPKSGGKYLSGLYSFVENFGANGNDLFRARYGNQWVRTAGGNWLELTQSRFSTTADPEKHPRFDIGAGLENGWFYMFSGGFHELGTTRKGEVLTRPATGRAPQIDLERLPAE
ncbi:DUF3472 domain-containing protein [Chitinophaga rhizosphaerae]|uniref:DUF3472 domain-containing protein n=1 Tax=Chitinophaga rhizosphaerae TaxID=1864947 RepID=UPI0013DEE731|nr:DUF3472 domain-containing protein [Chitinophaga rhizosphaerae]